MRAAKELSKLGGKALSAKQRDEAARLSDTGLSRPEWLSMLTAIAIKRFVETGDTPDVSEALQRLLGDVLAPRLPTHVLESRNHARRLACYKEAVVDALLPQLHTMHTVFAFYCTLRKDDSRKEEGMMSPSELLALCEDLLPGSCYEYLSERDVQRIFLTSRMRVIDPIHGKRRSRFRNLNFEDFMEGFVRLALITPVPTSADLAQMGVESAVEWYKHILKPESTELWDAFKEAHVASAAAVAGGSAPGGSGSGSEVGVVDALAKADPDARALATRLKHLLSFIAHKLAGAGAANGVSVAEMGHFARAQGRSAGSI